MIVLSGRGLLLLISVAIPLSFALKNVENDCKVSDERLEQLQAIVCASIGPWEGCPKRNVTARGDWPNQVIYYRNLLDAVAAPTTCLNTTTARNVVEWLDIVDVNLSPWWNTWIVFQVQYYDMPRKPGVRIESPATLGRKCWAFTYLKDVWESLASPLTKAVHQAGLTLDRMIQAYDAAVPMTMELCDKVLANCFVNASYDPARNGTCADVEGQFYVGFEWENGQRSNELAFPFATYSQTKAFHQDVVFAVNTALNEII